MHDGVRSLLAYRQPWPQPAADMSPSVLVRTGAAGSAGQRRCLLWQCLPRRVHGQSRMSRTLWTRAQRDRALPVHKLSQQADKQQGEQAADATSLRRRVPLVLPVAGKTKLQLAPEGIAVLRGISTPVSPVVVIGPYRSGKSFMLNQLLGVPCGALSALALELARCAHLKWHSSRS